jgi:hypothetical protein
MVYEPASSEGSEVTEFFNDLGLCEYCPLLEKQNIDSLKSLIGITATGLAEIGITSLEHQKKILANLEHTIDKHYQQGGFWSVVGALLATILIFALVRSL